MGIIRVSVRFTGRVQGVGFRATSRAIGGEFKVSGWVRNQADGSVQLEAQGESDEVERYLAAVHERLARGIESAHRMVVVPVEGEVGFEVRR